jgi:hypothetical protein
MYIRKTVINYRAFNFLIRITTLLVKDPQGIRLAQDKAKKKLKDILEISIIKLKDLYYLLT